MFSLFYKKNGWKFIADGNIEIGPGSYYIHNPNISVLNSDITNELDAFAFVKSFNNASPQNPIIMWNVIENRFLGHRLLFLSQNLDASPRTPDGFAQGTADFMITNTGPTANVYYQAYITWRMIEHSDIGIGSGSVYFENSSISFVNKDITSEAEAYEFTRVFNIMNPENPVIMWELHWGDGSYRAHRLMYLSQEDVMNDWESAEEIVVAARDFVAGNNREDKSNNVFYFIHN